MSGQQNFIVTLRLRKIGALGIRYLKNFQQVATSIKEAGELAMQEAYKQYEHITLIDVKLAPSSESFPSAGGSA